MNLIDNHVKGDECCPGMTLALSRVRPADKTGLMRSLSINMMKGTSSEPIILRINKSKKRS